MSREEAHKILDRIFDLGYKGSLVFNFNGLGTAKAKLESQEVSSESRIVAVAI